MTGFGKSEGTHGSLTFTVQVKSLNSKQNDLNLRLPSLYKEKEMDLRKMISNALVRGKIEVMVQVESNQEQARQVLNQELAESYYKDLSELAGRIGQSDHPDMLSLLVRMPDVLQPEKKALDQNEFKALEQEVAKAVEAANGFRETEGASMAADLAKRVASISSLLEAVETYESDRVAAVRDRIKNLLAEAVSEEQVDQNRFEQELIYYLEKYDINEEKVRLRSHCSYFTETMNSEGDSHGKKLGFIAQEMGREINTIGSKANHADIQKLVVQMKDELEKIKEQVLNVL